MNQKALFKTRNSYPPDFELVWQAYPKRAGANPKTAAARAYQTATKRGYDPKEILAGVERYAAYCEYIGNLHTQFVLRASTFFGPDCYWLEEWELPVKSSKPEWSQIPADDDALWPWAKEHGYPGPGSMTYYQYRRFLQGKVEERLQKE